jgi:hypothetical protein
MKYDKFRTIAENVVTQNAVVEPLKEAGFSHKDLGGALFALYNLAVRTAALTADPTIPYRGRKRHQALNNAVQVNIPTDALLITIRFSKSSTKTALYLA